MKNVLAITVFMVATLAWAAAQQSSTPADRSGGQPTSPNSQTPGAAQPQPSTPDDAGQAGSQGQTSNAPVTEGCLGGSNPNYTITDNAGTVYRLNIPPTADVSKLAAHIGESVVVQGDVKDSGKAGSASIDVQGIGRGTGKCPVSGSPSTQPPAKQ